MAFEASHARGTHFLVKLNAIHPFREGNGRTPLATLSRMAAKAGHPLEFTKLDPWAIMEAMIASFGGNEAPLERLVYELDGK